MFQQRSPEKKRFSGPTPGQQAFMARNHIVPDRPMNSFDARNHIARFVCQRRSMPPTSRQEAFLRQLGKWRDGMSRGEAHDLIRKAISAQSSAN